MKNIKYYIKRIIKINTINMIDKKIYLFFLEITDTGLKILRVVI